jgi:glutamate synthase domain-containing protein 3
MVRSCHLDTCPVGIATQRPELRAKFAATPEMIESYLLYVAEEVRRHLAALGLRSFGEAVGRADLLVRRAAAPALDLRPLLVPAGGGWVGEPQLDAEGGELGAQLLADAEPALDEPRLVEQLYLISTRDRAVGAALGGRIGSRFGLSAPPGRIRARCEGSAGQSFGAFLAAGVELSLTGEANDYVGKGMSGGRIVVKPPADDVGDPVLLGNTVLYGATGGELYCAGRAGERFAVRTSGAVAVVEGAGAHGCEYMTAGTVVILGDHGSNLGAGMTGGEIFVHSTERLNEELVAARRLEAEELVRLHGLLERHVRYTASSRATALLERWYVEVPWFWRVAAKAESAAAGTAADAG